MSEASHYIAAYCFYLVFDKRLKFCSSTIFSIKPWESKNIWKYEQSHQIFKFPFLKMVNDARISLSSSFTVVGLVEKLQSNEF